MSSPLRRDPPEMADADAEAGRMLATDADRAREARDWRTATAGGPPAVVAVESTPDRWHCYTVFGLIAAREIAKAAAADEVHPSEYIRDTVLADLARRTGRPVEEFRENLTVKSRPRGNRARALRT